MLKRVYNFTLDELSDTPRNILEVFFKKIPQILASEQMMMIQSIAVPHMEENDRKAIISELQRQMMTGERPGTVPEIEPERAKDHDDMNAAAAEFGFGFTVEGVNA